MIVTDKKERLKKELIAKGNLQGFENVISGMVDQIATSNCVLSCVDINDESKITQSAENGVHFGRIQIGFKNRKGEPITVIWDILHEYGHYLSGMPPNPLSDKVRMEREILAWEWAKKELLKYPVLVDTINSFNRYCEFRLNDYRIALKM